MKTDNTSTQGGGVILGLVLFLFPFIAAAATNELSAALQTGLFEEEANRNLPAAIESYEKVAKQFDQNRALAATAIFRLGEVNRKLGKTNEAATFYQRILREFSDQDTLAKLSQQNLAGMGMRSTIDTVRATANKNFMELQVQISSEEKTLESLKNLKDSQRLQAMLTVVPDVPLADLVRLFTLAEQRVVAARSDYGPDHPKVKSEVALMEDLKKKLDQRVEGVLRGMEIQLDAKREQCAKLEKGIDLAEAAVDSAPPKATAPITAVLDEEETEIRRIQAMIQNSPDLINAPSGEDGTPLYRAASKGQLRVAAFLLDHGAGINTRAGAPGKIYSDWMPLFAAANQGHKAMVELLLSRGANIEAQQSSGRTALHAAAEKGFQAVCECLLANKATINALNAAGQTALHLAVSKGHGAMVEFLLARGVDANVADVNGETALTQAAMAGHSDTLKRLIAAGAKTDVEDKVGRTPLSYAAGNGHFDSVTGLLAAKADPNAGKVNLPLHCAIKAKSAGIVEALLKAGADANRICKVTWIVRVSNNESAPGRELAPLALAMNEPQLDVVKLLLANKADPNGKRVDGVPLIFSALNDPEMTKAFLDAGAKPNVRENADDNARVPLMATVNPKVISLLLAAGADPEARQFGHTPLLLCASQGWVGSVEVAEALLKGGADVNARLEDGWTSLHFAAANKKKELMALLLARKADANARNNQGFTPLDLALGKHLASGQVTLGVGTPILPRPGGRSVTPKADDSVVELLRQHGGLADLPKLDRIEVTRPETGYRATAFLAGTNGWNQFTLAEVLAEQWRLISTIRSRTPAWYGEGSEGNIWANNALRFPDLSRVKIHSPAKSGGAKLTVNADLTIRDERTGSFRNFVLGMGDVVEVPEADHPVSQTWNGLEPADFLAVSNLIIRTVAVSIGGKSTNLVLAPVYGASGFLRGPRTSPSFMLRSVLDTSGLIRSSSDLTRVKVTRRESANAKPKVWIVDCSIPDKAPDLWLRDGDVIEVPEK